MLSKNHKATVRIAGMAVRISAVGDVRPAAQVSQQYAC